MSEKASAALCVDEKWHCKVYNSLYWTALTLLIDTEVPLHEKEVQMYSFRGRIHLEQIFLFMSAYVQ